MCNATRFVSQNLLRFIGIEQGNMKEKFELLKNESCVFDDILILLLHMHQLCIKDIAYY